MNPLPSRRQSAPAWLYRSLAFLALAVVCLRLSATSVRAGTFTYSTDWLGNTFSAAGTNAHVTDAIQAMAVAPNGTIFTDSYWDEAGGEASIFGAATGGTAAKWTGLMSDLHGWGRSGGEAVATNGTYVYVAMSQAEISDNPAKSGTQAGQPVVNGNNLPQYPVNNSGAPSYLAVTGNTWDCVRRYTLAGAPAPIATYGYGWDKSFTLVSTTESDSQISATANPDGASIGTSSPVMGIAANGSYVFVSDYPNNKIHVYNASTMAPVATWTSIPGPGRLALDGNTGILWVVENTNNNAASSIVGYDAAVTGTPTAKGGSIACGTGHTVGAANALAVDSSSRLLVADNGVFPDTLSQLTAAPYVLYPTPAVARIAVYTTSATSAPVYSYAIGQSVFSGSTPGKVTPLGFQALTGLGVDSTGSLYVSCTGDPHDTGTGAYIRKFASDAASPAQTWQAIGLQFVEGGALDPANLNQYYSTYSGYSMNWANSPATGTGTGTVATWNMTTFNPGAYPTDATTTDVTSDWLIPGASGNNPPVDEYHPMAFEVRDIGGKPFIFTDGEQMGNIFGVMRLNGNVAVPACIFGYNRGGWPSDVPKGKAYFWKDANGDGCMQAGEFTVNINPLGVTLDGKWVDENANLWAVARVTTGTGAGQVVEVTLASPALDSHGVPQYNATTPVVVSAMGTGNVTADTDWTGLVELAYLPASDTMILAGNTTTHTSGATNFYDVIRAYPHWSTATTGNKVAHAWEADGTSWKGLYAIGAYVFASGTVNNVNAVNVYTLSGGVLTGTFTPQGVATTGTNDEDNPINVRILPDGSYAVFQENDLTNAVTMYRWVPPNGNSFHTTNVLDSNSHTLLQATSTANAGQTDQATFAASVATAYANGFGGVVDFDVAGDALTTDPAIVANYASGAKTLTIGLTAGSALAAAPLAPPSGTTGATNCLSGPDGTTSPTLGDVTFTMGAVTGGAASEKVTSFSFTYLTETALNGLTVTVTATFSDGTTSVVTGTVNRNTTSPAADTFYGFVAPSGKSIVSVALSSNTTRADTTHLDDVGFVTASVP